MTSEVQTSLRVRWMIRGDLPRIVEIEQQSFEYAWEENEFLGFLRQRNCVGMVAVIEGPDFPEKIVGFVVYEMGADAKNILSIAVAPEARRTGVATEMIRKIIQKLDQFRQRKISAITRETNLGTQLFFRSNGFKATEVIRGYYKDVQEDAYVFEYRKGEC